MVEVHVDVVANAEVQRQAWSYAPVVLEPGCDLMRIEERIRKVRVRPLPLPDDTGRLEALGVHPVGVVEDDRRIVEERQDPIERVAVEQTDVVQEVVIHAELERVRPRLQRYLVL